MNLQSYRNTILILLFAIFLVCLFFLRTTTDPVLFWILTFTCIAILYISYKLLKKRKNKIVEISAQKLKFQLFFYEFGSSRLRP